MLNQEKAAALQKRIGYSFQNTGFLRLALTHSSYANEHKLQKIHHNERKLLPVSFFTLHTRICRKAR